MRLFGDLAPDAGGTEIVCGRDGKPFYASGPNDNFAAIMGYLRRKCGDYGFTFIVGGPGTI